MSTLGAAILTFGNKTSFKAVWSGLRPLDVKSKTSLDCGKVVKVRASEDHHGCFDFVVTFSTKGGSQIPRLGAPSSQSFKLPPELLAASDMSFDNSALEEVYN